MAAVAPFVADVFVDDVEFNDELNAYERPQPALIEQEIAERNLLLGRSREVPYDLRLYVEGLADQVAALPEDITLRVDPYLMLAAQRALIGALRALELDDASARRQLRLRLEQMRHVYRDLAEGGPLYEDRPAKELVRWLDDVLDVSQARLAELFGVSARTFQRWVSASDPAGPDGDDARRVRIVSAVANHLRHALTGPGVLAWFERPHPQLAGRLPIDVLDDPDASARLGALAASTRSFVAS
jgi:uncharacterized protein (DUF2384 family)